MSYSETVLPEIAETLSPKIGYIRNPKQYDLPNFVGVRVPISKR